VFCPSDASLLGPLYTDKKKKKFLIYKEIQMGSGAKSYMRASVKGKTGAIQ
jgi:hypothetical protein